MLRKEHVEMMEEMAPAQPEEAMPADMEADESGMEQASPEEQRVYNHFVAKAMMLVYDKKFFPKVVEMLKGEGDPMEGLARTAALVVGRVASAADNAGQKLTGDILVHAGKEVFEDLAELSKMAGIKDYTTDPDALEGAFFRAMDQFRMMLQGAGRLNQKAAEADLAKLEQMDQSGELEAMLSGLAAEDARAGKKPVAEGEEEPAEPPSRGLMRGES